MPSSGRCAPPRDHGDPTFGLSGRSAWGGWTATARLLRADGFLDASSAITELGRWRLAIELGEIASDTPPGAETKGLKS